MSRRSNLDDLQSYAVSVLRGGRGMFAGNKEGTEPAQPLELYEYERCPFCRKVREALCELDLEYISHPCTRRSGNRPHLMGLGGKQQVPFLVDPNTGVAMYESEDIIDYLHETYGKGRNKLERAAWPLNTLGSALATAVRKRGCTIKREPRYHQPDQRLILYSFEISPYCRKVREALCELDLDVHVKNVAKGSPRRQELIERGGKMQVPYLIDPNTGVEMYESDDIVEYLCVTYAA